MSSPENGLDPRALGRLGSDTDSSSNGFTGECPLDDLDNVVSAASSGPATTGEYERGSGPLENNPVRDGSGAGNLEGLCGRSPTACLMF